MYKAVTHQDMISIQAGSSLTLHDHYNFGQWKQKVLDKYRLECQLLAQYPEQEELLLDYLLQECSTDVVRVPKSTNPKYTSRL